MQSLNGEYETHQIDGKEIAGSVQYSANGEYRILKDYSGGSREDGHVIVWEGEEIIGAHRVAEPRSVDVANNGAYGIVDWIEYGVSTGCTLTVRSHDGEIVFEKHIGASSGLLSLSPNGEYVALCPYDGISYVYDIETGGLRTQHQNELGDRQQPWFTISGGQLELKFARSGDSDPAYAITVDGDICWSTDELENRQYYETITLDSTVGWAETLSSLIVDYKSAEEETIRQQIAETINEARLVDVEEPETLETIIDTLEARFAVFEGEGHKRLVAGTIAEASYRLAKKHKTTMGTGQKFWNSLMKADQYYHKILPWYDGKDGLAKVRRLQGRIYLNRSEYNAALDCLAEVESMEEITDNELTTEADERRLQELRERGATTGNRPHGGRVSPEKLTWD